MQIVISCAKDMTHPTADVLLETSIPRFREEAVKAAREMAGHSTATLSREFKCNEALATLNKERFERFYTDALEHAETWSDELCEDLGPALFTYDGIAFKHFAPEELQANSLVQVQQHLWIMSFLYGMLRPMDLMLPYRMEGAVRLDCHEGKTMFDWWKPRLTEFLLEAVKADDGVLLWCSTEEMKRMVDWKRVVREVEVIEPEFLVSKPSGPGGAPVLKSMSVFAKMCRGRMARLAGTGALPQQDLERFSYEGFRFVEAGTGKEGQQKLTFVADK